MRNYLIALVLCLAVPTFALWGSFGSGTGDLSGGGAPAGGDYLNIPEYNSTILFSEFTNSGVTVADNSFYGLQAMTNGTAPGASTWNEATNGIGTYRSFDGGDYITVTDSDNLSFVNDGAFTLSIWSKVDSGAASEPLITKYGGSGAEYIFAISGGTYADLNLYSGNNSSIYRGKRTDIGVIIPDVWQHLTVVYDSGGHASNMHFYINGVLNAGANYSGSGVYTSMVNTAQPVLIGRRQTVYYTGDLSTPRIWDIALTSDEVYQLFRNSCWPNPTNTYNGVYINPSHGWTHTMNENWDILENATVWSSFNPLITGSGSVVADQSTNENHGTLQNFNNTWGLSHGLGYPTNGVIKTQAANAKVDYGDLSDVDYGTNDFHIALWFNASDAIGSKRLVGKDNVTSQRQFALNAVDNGSTYSLSVWYSTDGGSGGIVSLDDSSVLQEDTWYHVIAQRVGNSFEIYTNGVLSASGTTAGSHGSMAGTTANLLLGLTGSGINDFAGWMDDFIIGQGSLTSDQRSAVYGNGEGWK